MLKFGLLFGENKVSLSALGVCDDKANNRLINEENAV